MNPLDEKISDALRAGGLDDPALQPRDPSVFELIFDTFKGRNRWLSILIYFWTTLFFALAVFCAVRFFQAEEVRAILSWAMGLVFCMIVVGLLKVWMWMQIDKNAILREVKRLELQVARLAARE